jgi:hypothetical protein
MENIYPIHTTVHFENFKTNRIKFILKLWKIFTPIPFYFKNLKSNLIKFLL